MDVRKGMVGNMRTIWNEYGGMILGLVGAVMVTGVVIGLFLPEGSFYETLMTFSRSIC